MTDRGKIIIAQIRHFTNIFFVFFIKRKHELIIIRVSFKKKHRKILWKVPNLRDGHLHPIGHLTSVYPNLKKNSAVFLFSIQVDKDF
jgi:hypothetical protein